jgi:hypothetical protein
VNPIMDHHLAATNKYGLTRALGEPQTVTELQALSRPQTKIATVWDPGPRCLLCRSLCPVTRRWRRRHRLALGDYGILSVIATIDRSLLASHRRIIAQTPVGCPRTPGGSYDKRELRIQSDEKNSSANRD